MKMTLAQTNRYYKNPEERRRRIERSAYESSFVEGATRLVRKDPKNPAHWPCSSVIEKNKDGDSNSG